MQTTCALSMCSMQVTKQDFKRAVTDNFGGQDEGQTHTRFPRSSNAYMLVYVREAEWASVMSQVQTVTSMAPALCDHLS